MIGPFGPDLKNGLVRCEVTEGLEPTIVVVGMQEQLEVRAEVLVALEW